MRRILGLLTCLILPACGDSSGSAGGPTAPPPFPKTVVFIGERNTLGVQELFAADATGTVINLSGPLVAGGDVHFIRTSNNGQWVAFVADKETDEVLELYAVPVAGGTPVKLSGTMVTGGDVLTYAHYWAPDDSRILFQADADVDGQLELYTATTAGGTPVRLAPAMSTGSVPVFQFGWVLGGTRVAYLSDQITPGTFDALSVPAGGGLAIRLTQSLGPDARASHLTVSPDGTQVALYAEATIPDLLQLYVVPAGGGTADLLSGSVFNVASFPRWDWSSTRIAFQEGLDVYTVEATGANLTKVSIQTNSLGGGIEWTGNSGFILYLAGGSYYTAVPGVAGSEVAVGGGGNLITTGLGSLLSNLFGTTLYVTSGGVPGLGTQLSGNPGWTVDVRVAVWSHDGTHVAYAADEDLDGFEELYCVKWDGTGKVKLSGTLLQSGISSIGWAWDSSGVYFVACRDTLGILELYAARPTGGTITRMSGPMVPGGGFRMHLAVE